MAIEIGRSFDEISKKIKDLNSEIRSARGEVRQLDSVLKLDPTNVDTATKRLTTMQKMVVDTTKRLTLLREQHRQASKAFEEGRISTKDFERLENQIKRTENELQVLELRTESVAKSTAKMGIEKLNAGLEKTERVARTVSRAVLGIVGALAAVSVSAIKAADELGDVAAQYQVTVEELQLQRNLYNVIATDAAGYENVLRRLSAIMKRVEAGAGTNYIRMLERLNVETKDINGNTKALGDIYTDVYNALRNVGDATERAAIANALFGQEGYHLANVAGTSVEEIEKLNNALIENGLISTEAAEAAGEIDDKFNAMKLQYMGVAVQLMQALMPSLNVLVDLLKETLIPLLEKVSNIFAGFNENQQKALLIIAGILIFLPKVIALVKGLVGVFGFLKTATLGQAAATGVLSAASLPLVPIFIAIAAALAVVIGLIALFNKNVKKSVEDLTTLSGGLDGVQNKYAGIGTGLVVANETITTSQHTKDLNINLDIEAEGDTPISDDNAKRIGSYLADEINLILGGKM